MIGQELNHYVNRRKLQDGLITGAAVTGLCGTVFTPTLRVGSDGRADAPDLMVCAMCNLIYEEMPSGATADEEVRA